MRRRSRGGASDRSGWGRSAVADLTHNSANARKRACDAATKWPRSNATGRITRGFITNGAPKLAPLKR
ncbi:unnamed protein product, partial [Iphiclides podalirius]